MKVSETFRRDSTTSKDIGAISQIEFCSGEQESHSNFFMLIGIGDSAVEGTLTKDALIEMIRDKVGYPVKEAKEILEIILEEVKLKLEEGHEVKISGFGKWTVKEKRSRPGRNPHTGDRIEISARRVVTFHPSDKLRDSVNQAFGGAPLPSSGSDD